MSYICYKDKMEYFFAALEFELSRREDEIEALQHALISYREQFLENEDDEEE